MLVKQKQTRERITSTITNWNEEFKVTAKEVAKKMNVSHISIKGYWADYKDLAKAKNTELGLIIGLQKQNKKAVKSKDKVEMIAEVVKEKTIVVESPIEAVEDISLVESLLERINDYKFRERVHARWMSEAITSGSIDTHELFEERIKLLNPILK